MRTTALLLAALFLPSCGETDLAAQIAGDWTGAFTGPGVASDNYTVTVTAVDKVTVDISGADFSTVRFPLMEVDGLITQLVTFTDGTLVGDPELGSLDFTWSAGQTLAFSSNDGDPDTDTDSDSDSDCDSDDDTDPAECDAAIADGASTTAVTSAYTAVGATGDFYLCPGATLNGTAAGARVLADDGATVNLTGDGVEVWARGDAVVNLTGDDMVLYLEDDVTTNLSGANQDLTTCDEVEFDLSGLTVSCPAR